MSRRLDGGSSAPPPIVSPSWTAAARATFSVVAVASVTFALVSVSSAQVTPDVARPNFDGLLESLIREDAFILESPLVVLEGSQTFAVSPGSSIRTDDEAIVASLYHADFGLLVLSALPVEGGAVEGRFVGDEVVLAWEGQELRVRSGAGRPIFKGGDRPAYGRVVPAADLPRSFVNGPSSWLAAGLVQEVAVGPSPLRPDGPPPSPPGHAGAMDAMTLLLVRPRVSVDGRDLGVLADAVEAEGAIALRLPDVGLVIMSLRAFDGAAPAGTAEGHLLQVRVRGRDVVVSSERPVAGGSSSTVYARLDAAEDGGASIGALRFYPVPPQGGD